MDLDPERCYQAILSRDRRFDGRFFTGVVTTGIYCRPVCPVTPPKFTNMRFYACAAAAEAAGFRPCKRCRPETAPGTPAWAGTSAVVSRGLRLIAEGGLDDGDLEAFAARLGIGERQLRRLFAQHLGASASEIARARRVHFARCLVDETDLPIAEIALASGFASIRQFNHALKTTFGKPPTALRGSRSHRRNAESSNGALVVKLPFRPPLAWSAMLDFLALRAIPGVEHVAGGSYRRTVEIGGTSGIIEVRLGSAGDDANATPASTKNSRDTSNRPHHAAHLLVRVEHPHCRGLIDVVERVRRIFDLGADSALIGAQLGRSAKLRPIVESLPGLRVPGAWDGFELAVRAILGQQISVEAATTLAGRIASTFGTPLAASDASLTHVFPKADALVDADLSRIGLPRARAEAIRGVARAIASGELRFDASLGLDEAVERLCALPGIGPWTANYIAMRALAEPDAFPETDLGLRHALGSREDPASIGEVRRQSDAWRPWRSYATIYLWHSLKTGIESKSGTDTDFPKSVSVPDFRERARTAMVAARHAQENSR
ncbi:MAG TPA: AlkA N-terminal domain-containing protein [Candidatus Limnocylindrales bacterium]|nr:AlkA N-terminal domain-containing protein [Candidatus Limnocylindrales bacterium]